jgi:hypothetical protein
MVCVVMAMSSQRQVKNVMMVIMPMRMAARRTVWLSSVETGPFSPLYRYVPDSMEYQSSISQNNVTVEVSVAKTFP